MIINTELATVTFIKDETFTVERLGDIIKVINDFQLAGLPQWERDLLEDKGDFSRLIYSFSIMSERTFNVDYIVSVWSDSSWTCTCPDFVNRNKRETGETCKHIRKVQQVRR